MSEQINFRCLNQKGNKIVGILTEGTFHINKVVVFCHGLCSSKEVPIFVHIVSLLSDNSDKQNSDGHKLSCLRFDFSGNGDSEGESYYGKYAQELADLECVVTELNRLGKSVFCLVGHSKGSAAIFQYGLKHQEPNKLTPLINLAGRYDFSKDGGRFKSEQYEQLKEDGFFRWKGKNFEFIITEKGLQDRKSMNLRDVTKLFVPVLTVHGEIDNVVSVSDAITFDKVIPNHTLKIIKDVPCNHFFTKEAMLVTGVIVRNWIFEQLYKLELKNSG